MMDNYINKIINGDNIEVLSKFEKKSIDLIVTSPPYDNLRDYKGYKFDLKELGKILFNLLKDGGVMVWVVKDSVINGNRTLNSYRQAIYFQDIGFNVYDVIIYSKTTSSLPHKNRYFDTFEYMFIFSKGLPKTINLITDRKNKYGGSSTYSKITVREIDGGLSKKNKKKIKSFSIRFNVWEYSTGKGNTTNDNMAFEHPAIFPEKLARDHIYCWSNPGDIVLDPMCGSGTVCKMAYLMNRDYIGIDISKDYCNISMERLKLYEGKQESNYYWDGIFNPGMMEDKIKEREMF